MRWLIALTLLCLLPGAISLGVVPTTSGGGAPVFLTDVTMTDQSGAGWTNAPLQMGLPFAPAVIDSSHSLSVVDQDTSVAMLCDEPNRASDLTPNIRFEAVRCINPSGTASEAKSLKAYVVSGAPASGTDIAVGDITGTAYDCSISLTKINGTAGTWTASPLTALSSGNSGWVNSTTPTVLGKTMSGGGIVTGYELFVPFTKSGTPDAQLHAIFHLEAFKGARTAVGGGNAILSIDTDVSIENAYAQTASPVDDFYGADFSACGGATFANSTPSVTLTLGGIGPSINVAVTAGSSLFNANSIGQVISNGTGVAVINGFTNATTVSANIYTAFGSTTVGSGTYTLYGTNHPYGAIFAQRDLWWVPSGSKPNTTSAVGDAWNNSTFTGGPAAYIIASKLINNYASTAGASPSTTVCGPTSLTQFNAGGTNPMAYLGGGVQFGAGGFMGDIELFLETSGERGDIGVIPDWDLCGLVQYDSNALTRIYGNAQRWLTLNVMFRDSGTGKVISPCNAGTPPTCSGNVNYVNNAPYTGTLIQAPSNPITPWSQDGFAHDPEEFYISYLLSGKYLWLEGQQFSAAYAWFGNDPAFDGVALQKGVWNNGGIFTGAGGSNGYQERGRTWAVRTETDATLLTPDTTPSTLGVTKTIWKDLLANVYNGTDGLVTNFVSDSTHWAVSGPRWTVNNNNAYSMFEIGYGCFAFNHQREQGMLDTNGLAAESWYCENETSMINDAGVQPQYTSQFQYAGVYDVSSSCPGTYVDSWTNAYAVTAGYLSPPTSLGNGTKATLTSGRNPNTTLTLSGTSGSGITATLGGGGMFAAGSFYVGTWITAGNAGANGRGRITAVNNANQVVIDTTASHTYWTSSCASLSGQTFSASSYSANTYAIPMPAPGDPPGADFADYIAGPNTDYMQIVQADTLLMNDAGETGASAACATVWGYSNSSAGCGVAPMSNYTYKWFIAHR